MRAVLKYGTGGLPIRIPETPGLYGIIRPGEAQPLAAPEESAARSLREPIGLRPLAELARGKKNACIVVSDSTRPVPNRLLLPPILDILDHAGIGPSQVLILIATGMHRPATPEEIETILGPGSAASCRIVNHDARSREDLVRVGTLANGIPASVNRHYVQADLKILTGFIEPHMWAGYSGGRKSLLPGISALETLEYMHGPEMVAHPRCEYGELAGNPFHEAGLEMLAMAGVDFIVNVTLDTEKRITGIFSGHPVQAHLEGCAFLSRQCLRELPAPLDFIVTTNSGAPLDCNLYQTVKGITAAAPVVKRGGDILIASRCPEGAGNPEYREVLRMADDPEAFLGRLMRREFFRPDQWCAQEMYQVILERRVWLLSQGLPSDEIRRYHLNPVDDLETAVQYQLRKHGHEARWAVVPDGPMVILKLSGSVGE